MRKAKFAAILVAVTGLVSLGRAQSQNQTPTPPPAGHPHGEPGMSPEGRLNKLGQELNLTEDQKTKVQNVFDEMRQRMEAAMEQARTNADRELKGILKPEQYQKLQDMWQQHMRHFEHHGGQQPGAGSNGQNGQTGQ